MALGTLALDALVDLLALALVSEELGVIETDGFDEGFILGLILVLGCEDGLFEGLAEADGFNEGSKVGIGEGEVEGFILGCADDSQSSAQKGPALS